jgi:hypothetical protein
MPIDRRGVALEKSCGRGQPCCGRKIDDVDGKKELQSTSSISGLGRY